MKADAAIIGGTGIGERLDALGGEPLEVDTREGPLNGRLVQYQGISLALVSRHSQGHKVPPHKVNYKALALGCQALGVRGCFGSAAVGCLRPAWKPGTLVVCSDFLDLTGRNQTLFDDTVVHTDFSEPFANSCRRSLIAAGKQTGNPVIDGGTYVGLNGPRFETPGEIRAYKSLGGDLVGMTASTEAILMREAGVPYAVLAIVTNPAAGMSANPLSHEEVVQEMQHSGERAVALLLQAAVLQVQAV